MPIQNTKWAVTVAVLPLDSTTAAILTSGGHSLLTQVDGTNLESAEAALKLVTDQLKVRCKITILAGQPALYKALSAQKVTALALTHQLIVQRMDHLERLKYRDLVSRTLGSDEIGTLKRLAPQVQ